ncbi:MAG: DNA polymerase IV [Alphaproteobacteria bacterium]
MHKPDSLQVLYLDFDGFFAAVMQQVMPALRGKPVGVVPVDVNAAKSTCLIASSREAKAAGVKGIMHVKEALEVCPDLQLVTQRPDLYLRAHKALLREIGTVIPVDMVRSIDEWSCLVDSRDRADPADLASRIKQRIRNNIGSSITCSIGFAANWLLAKIACQTNKPDGVTIWSPKDMPTPLLPLPISDVPGIGKRMQARLYQAGIVDMAALLATQPRQLRSLWGNVNGERMWYALHGFDIHSLPTQRCMYGHSRVLPPDWRTMHHIRNTARLLLTKAIHRMRRDDYFANRLGLSLRLKDGRWGDEISLPCANDYPTILQALEQLYQRAVSDLPKSVAPMRMGVVLSALVHASNRQFDLFDTPNNLRHRAEDLTIVMDQLNARFGKRVITLGPWAPPPGGYAGGKIAFNHIPDQEDFL